MAYKNLNIPATLVHTVNGKKYTLNGKLLSINESAKTCKMRFGNEIANDIPLKQVYLNETFLDDIKDFGRKAADKIKSTWHKIVDVVKSIAGFIVPVNDKGDEMTEYLNIPANVVCMELPASIKYSPSQATLDMCDEYHLKPINTYDIDDIFAEAEENECKECEKYFTQIMKVYGTSDKDLKESIKYVNENYYHDVFAGHVLNESIPSLHNLADYGMEVGTKALIKLINDSLIGQLTNKDGQISKPLLIWGAPGAGKTAIIKQAAKRIRNKFDYNLNMIHIMCSGLSSDEFELPDTAINVKGIKQAISVPKSWLPVYDAERLSAEEREKVDEYYNSGAFLTSNFFKDDNNDNVKVNPNDDDIKGQYNGGILFFDEFARLQNKAVMNIMMTLCGDRKYSNLKLASKWTMIAAANRLSDDNRSEVNKDFWDMWDSPKWQRFQMVTYVPTKDEWISWAREVNAEGYQNVQEYIVEFIEKMPDGVWMDCIDFGSRDQEVKSDTEKAQEYVKNVKNYASMNNKTEILKEIGRFVENPGAGELNTLKRTWSGRSWDEIIDKGILQILRNLFDEVRMPEAYDACFRTDKRYRRTYGGYGPEEEYTVKNLDFTLLGEQLDKIPNPLWFDWAEGRGDNFDRNGKLCKTNRLGFFMGVIGEKIKMTTGEDSLPARSWEEYQKAGTIIKNIPNIKSIWKKSTLYKQSEIDEDNLYLSPSSKYANIRSCEWKSSPKLIDNSIIALCEYDTNFLTPSVLNADIKNFETKYNGQSDKRLIDKWNEKYSFELVDENNNTKKYYPLFDQSADESSIDLATILEYSEYARYLANIALYACKISLQVNSNSVLTIFQPSGIYDLNKKNQLLIKNKQYVELLQKYPFIDFTYPAKTIIKNATSLYIQNEV